MPHRRSLRRAIAITVLGAAVFASAAGGAGLPGATAARKTVCTITVNSADEKEALRRYLPDDRFEFVELVEHGRSDWLASACSAGVRCDVLVISGHYDGGNEFFSDRTEAREFLPMAELERAACGDGCPGIFSQLKEVYLFGCNTLNGEALRHATDDVARSLVRGGASRPEAERIGRTLSARHGDSSRDRMRIIFKDVPVLYGFSSVAPLGPVAGALLRRHLQGAGAAEVGTGRANGRLLAQFSAHAMVATSGITDRDPLASHRRDVCQFADDGILPSAKLRFVHELLERPAGEVAMFLDRLESLLAQVGADTNTDPALAQARDAIAADGAARARFLDFVRDVTEPAARVRLLGVARDFHWLSDDQYRDDVVRTFDGRIAAGTATVADVDLACAQNSDGRFDGVHVGVGANVADSALARMTRDAVRACLGDPAQRLAVIAALTSDDAEIVRVAQVYLRHRPLDDVPGLRALTVGIARMRDPVAQARALQALGEHRLRDPQTLEELAVLYPMAASSSVQVAIAGVLLRADYQSIASPELIRTLRDHRRRDAPGEDMIDVLLRRLQAN